MSTFAATTQIVHKTCDLWIPTWKPQGNLLVEEAELLSRKLKVKGYNVRFGVTRSDYSDDELFLDSHDCQIRSSSLLRKGKSSLTLVLQDLNPEAKQREVYIDDNSITCFYFHSQDPASYKAYTKVCTYDLTQRFANLPSCLKL
jgi:hypothetical protein